QLGRQLIRFVRLVKRLSAQLIAEQGEGIEHAAYILRGCLVADGPRRTTALAEAVHSDPSTISRQVAALVRAGLVERRADPEDGRASLLAATETGTDVFERHRARRDKWIAGAVGGWPEE